jgi:tetratricopeptide (TPR) repeat protein
MQSIAAPARTHEWRAAFVKVAVVAAFACAVYSVYARHAHLAAQVADLLDGPRGPGGRAGGARQLVAKDTPAAWLAAEDKLERALALEPKNGFALAALAEVETLLAAAGYPNRAARAAEVRERTEERNLALPDRYEAHALALLVDGKAAESEQYVRALLAKYPTSSAAPRGWDVLGRAQRAQGKLDEARESFHKAADADAQKARASADYGELLLESGDAAGAVSAFDRALQASPDHPRARIGKARALLVLSREGTGTPAAAREVLDAILGDGTELPPELRARALAARAEVRLAQGDPSGASADADAALSLRPKLAAALRARALVFAPVRELRGRAQAELRAAIAADPYDASAWFEGARALLASGDAAGANELLDSDRSNPAARLARDRLQNGALRTAR